MEKLTAEQFVARFGQDTCWGLFVGSALSAAGPTSAPMVDRGLRGLLSALVAELAAKNEGLGAACQRIMSRVDRSTFAANLKLEVALSHLDAHARGASEQVVRALYARREPNVNHEAVGALHERGWALWVITTNFDGGLEQAGRFRVVATRPDQGLELLKLHGDAETGKDIVATMEGLVTGRNFRLAEGAMSALAGLGMNRMLVIGYSGLGDIDIMPALVRAHEKSIELWWAVRPKGSPPPGIKIAGLVTHNLEEPRTNLLCRLANLSPPPPSALRFPTVEAGESEARERLSETLGNFDLDQLVRMVVSLLLEANFGWQPAKLLLASERLAGLTVNHEQWHLACERMSAYTAAERHLMRQPEPDSRVKRASRAARRAFIVQEAGRVSESRLLFRHAIDEFRASDEEHPFQDQDFVYRGFLESEIERCESLRRRSERATLATKLLEMCTRLETRAEHEVPAVANLLKLRRAQLLFLSAPDADARVSALRLAAEALVGAIALQHTDGEAVARRFLVTTGGWRGWQLVRDIYRGIEHHTRRPVREAIKSLPSFLQGTLPLAMTPWKLQIPFVASIKRLSDAAMTLRLKARLKLWKFELRGTVPTRKAG